MSLQTSCYNILASYKDAQSHHKASQYFDAVLVTVIVLNIATMMLSTVPDLSSKWGTELHIIEVVSVALFTLEYVLRIWSSSAAPSPASQTVLSSSKGKVEYTSWHKRWLYLKSPMAIIDLLAILPFYFSMFLTLDLRVLRVFRVLRILKLGRYSRSIQTLITVIKNESHALIAAVSVLMLFTIIAATCIYYIEHTAQPDVFSSIPASVWWALVTLTTVGYGDIVPITPGGKIFGGLITILGICFYALPAGILSSSFTSQMQMRRDRFKDTVRSVLDDGVLSSHDANHLEKMRDLLDLDEEEARLIIRLLQHHHKNTAPDND